MRDENSFEWNNKQVEKLRELVAQNATGLEIAVTLNGLFGSKLSRQAVLGKISRLGWNRKFTSFTIRTRKNEPRRERFQPSPQEHQTKPDFSHLTDQFPPSKDGSRHWMTRQPWECQFPTSGDGHATYYCCAPMSRRQPYCSHHANVAFYKAA